MKWFVGGVLAALAVAVPVLWWGGSDREVTVEYRTVAEVRPDSHPSGAYYWVVDDRREAWNRNYGQLVLKPGDTITVAVRVNNFGQRYTTLEG